MSEREPKNEDKEADHFPYRRPVDAATLILVDRTSATPKVLVGRRHDKVVFQPGKIVFPGGRVDSADNRVPVAASIPAALEANLLKGSPKITPSRAGGRRHPRGLRGDWPVPGNETGRPGAGIVGPMEAIRRCRSLARSLRPFPDCARDHPARPR